MAVSAEVCRALAEECEHEATKTQEPEVRELFADLARLWRRSRNRPYVTSVTNPKSATDERHGLATVGGAFVPLPKLTDQTSSYPIHIRDGLNRCHTGWGAGGVECWGGDLSVAAEVGFRAGRYCADDHRL
jgi:hypothetical protein